MTTTPDAARARLRDDALSPHELAQIAADHPELRALVAAHRAAYPDLLTWLGTLGDPSVDAVLAARAATQPPEPVPVSHPVPEASPSGGGSRRRGPWIAVVGGISVLALAGGAFAWSQRGDDAPPATARPTTTPSPSPSESPQASDPTTAPASPSTIEPSAPPEPTDPGVTLASHASPPEVQWEIAVEDILPGGEYLRDINFPGAHDGQTALAAGGAVVVLASGEHETAVAALDPESRTVRWTRTHDTAEAFLWGCTGSPDGPAVFCVLSDPDDENVAWLEVLDASTGQPRSRLDLPAKSLWVSSTEHGGAFVGTLDAEEYWRTESTAPATLLEVDHRGQVLWSTELVYESAAQYADFTFGLYSNELETTALVGDHMYRLDRRGGAELLPDVQSRVQVSPDLAVEQRAGSWSIVLVDAAGSETTIEDVLTDWSSVPHVGPDRPLLVWGGRHIAAWDGTTAAQLWSTPYDHGWPLLVSRDVAVFEDGDGTVALDPRTGDVLWRTATRATWGLGFFDDGDRVIATSEDTIQALSKTDGSVEWEIAAPASLARYGFPTALAVDGRLVMLTATDVVILEPTG